MLKKIFFHLNNGRYLFFSSKTLHILWCLVFCSQLSLIAFSGLDYTGKETIGFTKESEEPKPKEGKAFVDLIEESKFLVTELPVFRFFSKKAYLSHFNQSIHTVFVTSLDAPPPDYI